MYVYLLGCWTILEAVRYALSEDFQIMIIPRSIELRDLFRNWQWRAGRVVYRRWTLCR